MSIDDVKLAVRLSACQPFPQFIEIVKDSGGNLCSLRVFIFSVPAQECSWVAPQYRSNVSSADKSSPVEDDLANSWGRLRSSNPPWHAGRCYLLVGRPALFDRRQRRGDPAGMASTYPRSLHQVAVEQLLAQHLRSGATCPGCASAIAAAP